MKLAIMAVAGVIAAGVALAANAASNDTNSKSDDCKVVHLKPGENPPSGMSTSITAGNGQVSGQTNLGNGGTGVSVGSGSSATSGAAAHSVSTSSNGKTTTVTTSDGNCTVYMRDEK
jgi:hypothetical protein